MAVPTSPPASVGGKYVPLNGWVGSDVGGYVFYCEGLGVGWKPPTVGAGGSGSPTTGTYTALAWWCLSDGDESVCLAFPAGETPLPISPFAVAGGPYTSESACETACDGPVDPDPGEG